MRQCVYVGGGGRGAGVGGCSSLSLSLSLVCNQCVCVRRLEPVYVSQKTSAQRLTHHNQRFSDGLKLLVYEALSYLCMRPDATCVCGLKLLVYEALNYS